MLNPNRLNSMLDSFFIRAAVFETVKSLVVQSSGAIGTNMEIGLSLNTDAASLEGGTGITAERNLILNTPIFSVSAAAGNPRLVEVALTPGFTAFLMDTAGDEAVAWVQVPRNMDWRHGYRAYVHWSSTSVTAADTVNWKLLTGDLIVPEVTTMAITPTATAFPQETVAGIINRWQKTAGLDVSGSSDSIGSAGSPELFMVGVEMDAKAGGLTEAIHFHGLEIEYTVRAGRGLKRKSTQRFVRS